MADNPNITYVHILDKEYQVACPPNERAALNQAAEELDKRMRAIRTNGNIIGIERIAIMAALNLCHELHDSTSNGADMSLVNLKRIAEKLDHALIGN